MCCGFFVVYTSSLYSLRIPRVCSSLFGRAGVCPTSVSQASLFSFPAVFFVERWAVSLVDLRFAVPLLIIDVARVIEHVNPVVRNPLHAVAVFSADTIILLFDITAAMEASINSIR